MVRPIPGRPSPRTVLLAARSVLAALAAVAGLTASPARAADFAREAARESIDHDIRMSHAEPVPAEVLRAEVGRQPSLARYPTGRKAQVARAGAVR